MVSLVFMSLLIGWLLGLLGGGGSILTVPVLVYLAGLEPKAAIATSLVVVGTTSLTAVLNHARNGRVCWKTGLWFGLAGMLGAYVGGRLAAFIPGEVLLILFAAIMLGAAYAMLRRGSEGSDATAVEPQRPAVPPCSLRLPLLPILFDGLLVGMVTGLVGIGGGFLVVPALNLLGRLPMPAAIGTSLLVISLNSLAALAGYASHLVIDLELAGIVTGAAIVGSIAGAMLSNRLSGSLLRRIFGVFIVIVAAFLLYRELKPELLRKTLELVLDHADFVRGAMTVIALQSLYRLAIWLHGNGKKPR